MFAFYWVVDLLDLHSFPTRRSSDLSWTYRYASSNQMVETRSVARSVTRALPCASRASSPKQSSSTSVPIADRKSTRLNSSHLGISYAVFCLKKKNEPILRH